MPNFNGKKITAFPVEFDGTYTEGDTDATMTGLIFLGEKPGNTAYPVQLDADGFLRAVVEGGIPLGTEYSDGAVNTASKGTLIMGDDGANIQNVLVDSSGRLQVEVVEGHTTVFNTKMVLPWPRLTVLWLWDMTEMMFSHSW